MGGYLSRKYFARLLSRFYQYVLRKMLTFSRGKKKRSHVLIHPEDMSIIMPFVVCPLCGENILEKRNRLGRRFGILDCCSCDYCIICLMINIQSNIESNFRSGIVDGEVLARCSIICPICRNPSNMLVSSTRFCTTLEERLRCVLKFKEALKNSSCPFIKRGIPVCYCIEFHHSSI